MVVFAVILLWSILFAAAFVVYRTVAVHQQNYARFAEATFEASTGVKARNGQSTPEENRLDPLAAARFALTTTRSTRRLTRRWAWVPWVFGVMVALSIGMVTEWPIQYTLAIGFVISLLASQLEGLLHTRQIAKLENQLADSIDIMVGALGAGAAVGPAIEAATYEVESPLQPYLEEISGRIRLGDDPLEVFRSLSDRVPLETFLLFSSALAVHWEVGGRLAPTLASVGRTIRDRIEVNRRIQSNIAQSQFSTFAIIGLIYLIALIVWRNGPEAMQEFVSSSVGSWLVASSIMLQAVGIFWMDLISKPRF